MGQPAEPDAPPSPWARLLVLLGLTGFALSQPLLSLLGDEPGFFTFRDAGPVMIVSTALAIIVVPPLALFGVDLLAHRINRRLGTVVHLGTVAVLVGLTVLQIEKYAGLHNAVLQVALAALGAGLVVAAYQRVQLVGSWLRFTAILPALALILFAFFSPTSDLLRGSGGGGRGHR